MQSDGKIVVGGTVQPPGAASAYAFDFLLYRYNADGSLDTSFGTGGVTQVMLGDGQNSIGGSSLTIAADGKIILAGYGTPGSGGQDMVVIRVNSDGSLDDGKTGDADPSDAFGDLDTTTTSDLDDTTGVATVDFSGGNDRANAVAITPDGGVILAGYATVSGSTYSAVVKLTDAGALDTSFNAGGSVPGTLTALTAGSKANAVATDGLGRITVAGSVLRSGYSDLDLSLFRLLPDGSFDSGFGASGTIQTDVSGSGSADSVNALALTPAGGVIVAGGTLISGGNTDFAIARYNPGGQATQRLYALQDANFNVTALADAEGTIVQRFQYDPYGKSTVLSAGWLGTSDGYDWLYRHQGGRLETATGKYSFRFRDYDPELGRWMEEDPAGYVDGANLYAAYDGSPVVLVDPSGLRPPDGIDDGFGRPISDVPRLKPEPLGQVVDADLSGYFDSIPHAELLQSLSRRISDGALMHLLKSWLCMAVEEDDERGRRHRTTRNRDEGRGTPQGAPISPLLSNLYMRRFVLGWKTLGYQDRLKAYVVNYADDLVICCRGSADEALSAMREMMSRLKLTVNEAKTRVCVLPAERFDFLGYTFGRLWSPRTGRPYLGVCPSKKRVQRICDAVTEATDRRSTFRSVEEVVADVNRKVTGWANYFSLGSVSKAYSTVDNHVGARLRMWLLSKHKQACVGKRRFIDVATARCLGLLRLQGRKGSLPWAKA